jgi:ATP-dependent Clp endopeptidase proteolytic subunit ClpP
MNWFEMKAKGNDAIEILIYDEIGGWGVTAKDFAIQLNNFKDVKNITLRLNTPGGSVMDGNAIFNSLKRHKARVNVEIDGMALSMGSVIAMAGDTISMAQNAMFMIHNPWGMAIGDSEELRKTADVMDKMKGTIITPYVNKTGMSAESVSNLMDAETWMNADEALEAGFVDSVTDAIEIAANFDLSKFHNVPDSLTSNNKLIQKMNYQADKTIDRITQMDSIGTLSCNGESIASITNITVGGNVIEPITTFEIAEHIQNAINQNDSVLITPSAVAELTKEEKPMDKKPATADSVDTDKIVEDATVVALASEKTRTDEIRAVFKLHGDKYRDLMDKCLTDQNCSTDHTRKLLLDEIGKGQEALGGTIELLTDAKDRYRTGMIEALSMRSGHIPRDGTNEFQSFSLMDVARESLRISGVSTRGMNKMQIVGAAFTHSTSDFPWLLENVIGKELQRAYGAFPETWSRIADVGSVPDFKVNSRIRLGSFNSLDTIPEGEEYTGGSFSEERESITAGTKGKFISLTRQAIINDDLGGFNRIAQMMGRAAARTIGNDVYALLNSNPVMSDSITFFHASHNNLAGTGAAPTVTTVGAGRSAMRLQQDPDGNDSLDIRPSIFAVPVALEDTANVLVASETDPNQANSRRPNPIRGFSDVVSDPRLDSTSTTAWYLFADPSIVPSFEVAFLDGNQTPFLESENGFTIDGVRWKVRLDYGVAAIDWRGGYKNDGV